MGNEENIGPVVGDKHAITRLIEKVQIIFCLLIHLSWEAKKNRIKNQKTKF